MWSCLSPSGSTGVDPAPTRSSYSRTVRDEEGSMRYVLLICPGLDRRSGSAGVDLVRRGLVERGGETVPHPRPHALRARGPRAAGADAPSRRPGRRRRRSGPARPPRPPYLGLRRHRRGHRPARAALRRERPGPYQVQAAIAACHTSAAEAADTDWAQIARLYGELVRLVSGPVVELNRAVAVARPAGPGRVGPGRRWRRPGFWPVTTAVGHAGRAAPPPRVPCRGRRGLRPSGSSPPRPSGGTSSVAWRDGGTGLIPRCQLTGARLTTAPARSCTSTR